ncbi:uncharacterized protein [Ovis canadensis]|uniref:uncharacterized protein isoform X3 n=1 Tax=Ovis canadensis TaxID=37174 RepID=UPI003753329F
MPVSPAAARDGGTAAGGFGSQARTRGGGELTARLEAEGCVRGRGGVEAASEQSAAGGRRAEGERDPGAVPSVRGQRPVRWKTRGQCPNLGETGGNAQSFWTREKPCLRPGGQAARPNVCEEDERNFPHPRSSGDFAADAERPRTGARGVRGRGSCGDRAGAGSNAQLPGTQCGAAWFARQRTKVLKWGPKGGPHRVPGRCPGEDPALDVRGMRLLPAARLEARGPRPQPDRRPGPDGSTSHPTPQAPPAPDRWTSVGCRSVGHPAPKLQGPRRDCGCTNLCSV